MVGGAAGTVSRITGALGKGIASLTFDEKFLKKRREAIKKRGNQNFRESLARSSKGLAMGIVEGVTGVATKPYQGARDDGVGGFFKGVGKGDLKSFLVFIFLKLVRKNGDSTDLFCSVLCPFRQILKIVYIFFLILVHFLNFCKYILPIFDNF